MGILNLNGDAPQEKPEDSAPEGHQMLQVKQDNTNPDLALHTPVNSQETDPEKAVVVMDGPLGHIYTQALNLAFAKEDTGTMFSVLMKKIHEHGRTDATKNPEPALVDENGTYVYAIDDKELDSVGLVTSLETIREAVNSKRYKRVVLAMESGHVSSKMQLLDQASRELGVTVCLTRNRLIDTVMGR